MREVVNIYAAKTNLSRLVDRARAGDEIVIARHGRPVARLVPVEHDEPDRRPGLLAGKIEISDDFDAPLPDAVVESFRGSVMPDAPKAPKKPRRRKKREGG